MADYTTDELMIVNAARQLGALAAAGKSRCFVGIGLPSTAANLARAAAMLRDQNGQLAEFLANEVPGVTVPKAVLDRMKKANEKSKEHALAEGIAVKNVGALTLPIDNFTELPEAIGGTGGEERKRSGAQSEDQERRPDSPNDSPLPAFCRRASSSSRATGADCDWTC